eukprot:COSAG01_NODE_23131_length_827_cov_1.380495_1_plen_124_part_00
MLRPPPQAAVAAALSLHFAHRPLVRRHLVPELTRVDLLPASGAEHVHPCTRCPCVPSLALILVPSLDVGSQPTVGVGLPVVRQFTEVPTELPAQSLHVRVYWVVGVPGGLVSSSSNRKRRRRA